MSESNKSVQQNYQPISCSFHDVLEASATLRKNVEIRFLQENGSSETIHAVILDIYTQDRAEFIKLDSNQSIRLDQLISVDGTILRR